MKIFCDTFILTKSAIGRDYNKYRTAIFKHKPKGGEVTATHMMPQTVYIDLYFLVNFSMDLLCLMITASLLHRKVKRLRAILAASIGGIYASASLLLGFSGIGGLFLDAIAAIFLCAIVFYTKNTSPWRTLQCVPILLFSSMTLGGVMTALYNLLNRLHLPFEALEGDGLSVWIFALLTAVSGIATLRGGQWKRSAQNAKSVTLEITLFQQHITLRAMVDSGNLLRDPVSGVNVIVADLDRLAPILPPALTKACRTGLPEHWLSSHEHARITRLIPASGATGNRLLLAIVPERLTVIGGKEMYSANHLIAPAPLGEHAKGFDAVIGVE